MKTRSAPRYRGIYHRGSNRQQKDRYQVCRVVAGRRQYLFAVSYFRRLLWTDVPYHALYLTHPELREVIRTATATGTDISGLSILSKNGTQVCFFQFTV